MNVSSPFEWLLYIFQPVFSDSCTDLYSIYIYIWGDMWHSSQNLFMHWKKPLLPGSSYFLITEVSYLLHISNSKKTREKIRYAKCEWIFFGPPKSHKTTNSHGRKKWNPGPVKLANPIDFHLWFLPLSPLSPGDFFFLGSADFLLVPGFLWKSGWVYEECPEKWWFLIRRRSPTKTCKTYTMLDLWEDEDAWKERGVSKKHVPYWAVMLEFRVNGDNYFTRNFCTSSFSEWHHSSTNYLVISSHPPIWKKIWFLQGSPLKFRG